MKFGFLVICLLTSQLFALKPPASRLYPILWDWFKGQADSAYFITEHTYPGVADRMKTAFQVRRAREFWYNKNLDSFQAGHFNWLPVTDFLGRFQTIRGFWRSGINMVQQTVGGYTVHITPAGRDSLRFTVLDIKSRRSLFLHIPLIHNRTYDGSRNRQKPMTNTHWVIQWTEPVHTSLFYRRIQNMADYPRRHYSGHNF